LAEGIQKFIYT